MSENKKLTIEEIAEIKYPLEVGYGVFDRNCQISDLQEAYVEGYKLAQDKFHNDEEVIQLVSDWIDYRISEDTKSKVTFKRWFEQFKKK
jgi:hypothetical protein